MSISTFLCKDSLSVIICQMSKFRPGHNLLLTFNGFTENFKLWDTCSWKHMHHLTYPTPPQSKQKEKCSKANIFFVQIFIHISICGLIYKSKDYIYCMKETKLVCVCNKLRSYRFLWRGKLVVYIYNEKFTKLVALINKHYRHPSIMC